MINMYGIVSFHCVLLMYCSVATLVLVATSATTPENSGKHGSGLPLAKYRSFTAWNQLWDTTRPFEWDKSKEKTIIEKHRKFTVETPTRFFAASRSHVFLRQPPVILSTTILFSIILLCKKQYQQINKLNMVAAEDLSVSRCFNPSADLPTMPITSIHPSRDVVFASSGTWKVVFSRDTPGHPKRRKGNQGGGTCTTYKVNLVFPKPRFATKQSTEKWPIFGENHGYNHGTTWYNHVVQDHGPQLLLDIRGSGISTLGLHQSPPSLATNLVAKNKTLYLGKKCQMNLL